MIAFLNNWESSSLSISLDDEHPTSLADLDSTQLKIADRIKKNILLSPIGLFNIVTEIVEGVTVIKVLIYSGLVKPYYIRRTEYPFSTTRYEICTAQNLLSGVWAGVESAVCKQL